jgi:oligo-1,6-glucosidase
LKVNPNHETLNVQAQEKDPNSTLNYFRKIVQLRKQNPVLVYGKYTLLDKANPNVYAYTRVYEGKKVLIVLNFSDKNAETNTGLNLAKSKLLLSNYPINSAKNIVAKTMTLRPYEAVVYQF